MDFSDLITDINNYSIDFYQSSLTDKYHVVTKKNYLEYAEKATEQFTIMLKYENISGFFMVDWRVNFANLIDYLDVNLIGKKQNLITTEFINYYKKQSTNLLYKRLGIE